MTGFLSAIKEYWETAATLAGLAGLFCFMWTVSFCLSPVETVKDTKALLQGEYSSKYAPGDPRRWDGAK